MAEISLAQCIAQFCFFFFLRAAYTFNVRNTTDETQNMRKMKANKDQQKGNIKEKKKYSVNDDDDDDDVILLRWRWARYFLFFFCFIWFTKRDTLISLKAYSVQIRTEYDEPYEIKKKQTKHTITHNAISHSVVVKKLVCMHSPQHSTAYILIWIVVFVRLHVLHMIKYVWMWICVSVY